MTEPQTPAEVMLAVTRATLRSGKVAPAQVTKRQLDALTQAGYRLRPVASDGGHAMLLTTAKKALWSGRFRPADVIDLQLHELEAEGYTFKLVNAAEVTACEEFVWGPNSFDSCEECGLSFWRHGESGTRDSRTHHRNES